MSSHDYTCPHTSTCVLIPLHMGAHTSTYVYVLSTPLQTGRSASAFARRSSRRRNFAKMSSLCRDPRDRWPRVGNSRRARKRKVQGGQTKGTDITADDILEMIKCVCGRVCVCVCVGVCQSVCSQVSASTCVSSWSASYVQKERGTGFLLAQFLFSPLTDRQLEGYFKF